MVSKSVEKHATMTPLEVLGSVPVCTRSKFSPFRWLACKYEKRCHKLTFGEPQGSQTGPVWNPRTPREASLNVHKGAKGFRHVLGAACGTYGAHP